MRWSAADAKGFVRSNPMLCASAVLCMMTVILVRPPADVLGNIDVGMLTILFCFMAAIAGLRSCGAFDAVASRMLSGRMSVRTLCTILGILPLACSTVITNDVSLITFVPFSILVLDMIGRKDLIAPVAVLQTLAANTGCMLLPFGSPHNLLIYSAYSLDAADVMMTLAPYVAVGSVLTLACCVMFPKDDAMVGDIGCGHGIDRRGCAILMAALAVCVASVLRIVPLWMPVTAVLAAVAVSSRRSILDVDYGLMATFVFLFILVGTVTGMDAVGDAVRSIASSEPMLSAFGFSQIVSNVPAATLLSGFTDDWRDVLIGINIGGFGTPIASMASVITFGLCSGSGRVDMRRFAIMFLIMNAVMAAALLATYILMSGI